MDELNQKKLNVINIQLVGSSLFIVSLIVTIILTINQKKSTLHEQPLFTTKQTYVISNLNRILALGVVLAFLYSSYELREISIQKESDVGLNDLDVFASILSVLSGIIALYITAASPVEDSLDIENPNI